MYLKLMVRGLRRHRSAGARFFVLLGACSAAVLFCLSFRDSFVSRFQQLGIDTATAHLQILPADSPKVQDMAFADQREGLSLLTYSPALEQFLTGLPDVEHVMLAVETRAAVFTTEGEQTTFAPSLMGVDPVDLSRTLPGVTVLEGARDLAWRPGMADVPVFRPPLEFWEIVKDNDRFTRSNFRVHGAAWDEFKERVEAEMPALFSPPSAPPMDDAAFLSAMNKALDRADLALLLPARATERYDYRVDDARSSLAGEAERAAAAGPSSPQDPASVRVLRKRLLQSVYPDAITPVRDAITLNVSYTMAIPAARGDDPLARPAILPVAITAYVQRLPLFFYTYYMDARPLRQQLGVAARQGTSIFIRVSSREAAPRAKQEIEAWLSAHEPGYVVRDYADLGRLFLSAASGFAILTLALIAIFMASATIFMVNTVLLSLMKRRREIGTNLAIGLLPGANALILFGEVVVLVAVSWAGGTAVGAGVILLFHGIGLPGIIFMPEGRLFLDLSAGQVAVSLALFLSAAVLASLPPLLRLARVAPLTLLKEASA